METIKWFIDFYANVYNQATPMEATIIVAFTFLVSIFWIGVALFFYQAIKEFILLNNKKQESYVS